MSYLVFFILIFCEFSFISQQVLHQITAPFNLIEITTQQINLFKQQTSDDNYPERFSNLLLINNRLYFTGRNHIYCLDALRISNPDLTKKYIPAIGHNSDSVDKNYFGFLAFRKQLSDLIVCGVDIGYDLNEVDLSSRVEYNGEFMCPGLDGVKNLNLISFDSQVFLDKTDQAARKGLMYSGIWISNQPSNRFGVFSQYGIFRKAIEVI